MRYDVAIIGAGGAAFAAAITAAGKGASVVMIERGEVGGSCVNVGCVPSKALLAAAEARHVGAGQAFPGIATTAAPVDAAALIGGTDALVGQLRADKYVDLAAGYGWEIVAGAAAFADGPVLDVTLSDGGSRRIEADQYLIATGSAPWAPPIPGLAEAGYLTSTAALELDHIPESLIVLGGNAVGLEIAQLFARLGAQVSVVEALDRLAPFEEPEISAALRGVLVDEGIAVHAGATVTAVSREAARHSLTLAAAGQLAELSAEQLLVATGRRPITADLNLDAVDVKTGDRGDILVDEQQHSSNPRVWAAGDVTGGPQFVYVAAAQGSLAAANALTNAGRSLDYACLRGRACQRAGRLRARPVVARSAPAGGLTFPPGASLTVAIDHIREELTDRDPPPGCRDCQHRYRRGRGSRD